MAPKTFEEVWRLLHKLEGKTVNTLVSNRRNQIVKFLPKLMIRRTETNDGKHWKDPTGVPRRAFSAIWRELASTGVCEIGNPKGWYLAAACLMEIAELGVETIPDRRLTLRLVNPLRRSSINNPAEAHVKEPETPMENSHIVVDPNICSGKPCIRGTRIMVTNILGMMAGGYSVRRVVESYPELTKADVSAALEYASQIIDEEKIIARR